jgi:mono/diheme cytochrome c family protein
MTIRTASRLAAAAAAVATLAAVAAAAAGQQTATPPRTSLLTPSLSGIDNFTLYCAPCHGRDGKGGGPVANALKTPPADLTRISIRNKGVFPADRVRRFVTNGAEIPAHGSSAMPVWGPTFRALDSSDKLVDVRIANVIAYVESIQQ